MFTSTKILPSVSFLFFAFFLLAPTPAPAQDPSPAPTTIAPVPSGPGSALRDILSAACSQDEKIFASFLTTRSKESFAHLTPPARVALMKRFVLLNEPGKSSVTLNPSGRPIVRCETPSVATEMQIGGADLRDNVAFLPLELRDSADATGNTVHHITMGLVREDGQWRMLSIGVLLLDLPSLEVEWDTEVMDSNELHVIDDIKQVAAAVETYRRTYSRLPDSLTNLGPALHGAPSADGANMLDSDLSTGSKNGYNFRYVIRGAGNVGAPALFELSATPAVYGRTGRRSFFRDSAGKFHSADRNGAVGSDADPRVD
jgi:hypothetical protein